MGEVVQGSAPDHTGEPRYTLAEALRILNDACAGRGHDLKQVQLATGPVERVYCRRCPATFGPPDLPELPAGEVRQDVYRSGSAPGSVRLTHIPTGIAATCDGGDSETANLGRAQLLLRARLLVARLEREANP